MTLLMTGSITGRNGSPYRVRAFMGKFSRDHELIEVLDWAIKTIVIPDFANKIKYSSHVCA
jgi:hypothetical protein